MTSEARGGCLGALFGQRVAVPDEEALNSAPPALNVRDEDASRSAPAALNLRIRADFLSTAELSFFRAAELATRGRYLVMTKINLGDLFFSPTGDQGDRNKIDRKHVDFLLCDIETLRPVLGIELDDSSHARAGAAKRDATKDAAFASAGLPLLRVPVRRGYATTEVSATFDAAIERRPATVSAPAAPPADTPAAATTSAVARVDTPTCPRCGVAMVLRPGVAGRYDAFFGCPNYPRCRERKLIPTK